MSEPIFREKIRRDGGTQSRAQLDQATVEKYAQLMREGTVFDPIGLTYDGEWYWVWDGFHRDAACELIGKVTILADVTQGTQRDAVLLSVGANPKDHLNRTNADKRRAVETLLMDAEWVKWSDHEIARRTGVSHPTVKTVREELIASGKIYQIDERVVTRGGQTYTQTVRHWALITPMAFWDRVKRLGLDKNTILQQVQPDAAQVTDLQMDKASALRRLDELATARNAQLYPTGSYVYHFNHHIFLVRQPKSDHILAADILGGDEQAIIIDGIRPATPEEVEGYLHPPYPIGSKLTTDVSDVVGEVIALRPLMVCVRRRNPGASTNVTNWVNVENVRPAPAEQVSEFQVGDHVRTHTLLNGEISKIKRREHFTLEGVVAQKMLYYLESHKQPFYAEQLTKIDPPVPDEQPAADPLAGGGWHKFLSSSGLLSAANRFPNWYEMNWIERYRAIKLAFCPDLRSDPLLLIDAGTCFYALDADAQAIGGALHGSHRTMTNTLTPAVSFHGPALVDLHKMGAVGVISYRELNIDLRLLGQPEPVIEDDPDSQPPLPPPLDPLADEPMLRDLYNFGFSEIAPLRPALQRILLYINGLAPLEQLPDDLHLWREFLDRVEATAAQAVG